ncbi:MAG: hypothetical protein GYB53_19400 [Rhodobacteraceae bacterium]|nr:hypothetical protein [Paracoccaceae bacterium]MBR9820978.1 hypothetical protein [Paracoccaceae bacterium]
MRSASVLWIPAAMLFACLAALLALSGFTAEGLEAVSALANLIVSIAAAAAAVIAGMGLSSWKASRQYDGDYALARDYLVGLSKAQQQLRALRYPVIWSNEGHLTEDEKEQFPDLVDQSELRRAKVYIDRWSAHTEEMVALYALKLQAMAVWGDSFEDHMKRFNGLERELFRVVRSKIETIHPANDPEKKAAHAAMLLKERDILHDTIDPEPDSYAKDVEESLSDVRAFLRKKLGGEDLQ